MKLITKRELIDGVAAAWFKAYQEHGAVPDSTIMTTGGLQKSKRLIYEQLSKLELGKATEEQVAAIIGHYSWTQLKCHECKGTDQECLVIIGEEPCWESATAQVCESCLMKAVRLINPDNT